MLRRGGRRPSRTEPGQIETRLRHAEWLKRRLAGEGITAIAEAYGCAPSSVCEAITRLMAAIPRADGEHLRELENQRLDYALSRVWTQLDGSDPAVIFSAAAQIVRISKRRSEINGLDRPAAAPVGPDGKPVAPTVNVHYHQEPIASE